MTIGELREEIAIETELIEAILIELEALRRDVADHQPTVREATAAAAFLAQFYGGVENILKRISLYFAIPLPAGDNWHSELFQRFCEPAPPPVPVLFDIPLEKSMAPYRKFRHVAFHSYGMQLNWGRMEEGIAGAASVFRRFREKLENFLDAAPQG